MGFLDKVFSQVTQSNQPTVQAGFVQLCVAASGADGVIDNDEWGAIIGYVSRLKMFAEMKDSEISKLFQKAIGILEKKGAEALIEEAVSQIPEELRNTAFACVCDIVLSDGELESDEQAILEKAFALLEIEEKQATTIMEVMLIKNKM